MISSSSIRNVSRRLRVTCRLHVPLRSPVSMCAFHVGRARNSSGCCIASRNVSILRSLSTVSALYALRGVVLVEAAQALVSDAPDLHAFTVTLHATAVKRHGKRAVRAGACSRWSHGRPRSERPSPAPIRPRPSFTSTGCSFVAILEGKRCADGSGERKRGVGRLSV